MPKANACHPSAELLSAFAVGTLAEHLTPAIAAHVAACPECQEKAESLPPDSFVSLLKASAPRGDTAPPSASTNVPDERSFPGWQSGDESLLLGPEQGVHRPRSPGGETAARPAALPELLSSGKYEVLGKSGHLALQQFGAGVVEFRKVELQELHGSQAEWEAPPETFAGPDPADPRGKWEKYQVGQHFRGILWHDETGWHFRTTQHRNSTLTHRVSGVITAIDGEVRDLGTQFPKGFVPGGSAKVTDDGRRLVFDYRTKGRGGEAGFDFKLSKGCRLLRCAIALDSWHPTTELYIGRAGANPKSPVFLLKVPNEG